MNANAPHDANAVALDVDITIDRALSALRDAQPRSGSEMLAGRILAHLEHRTTAHHITEPGGLPFHSFIVKGWGIARGSAREKPLPRPNAHKTPIPSFQRDTNGPNLVRRPQRHSHRNPPLNFALNC